MGSLFQRFRSLVILCPLLWAHDEAEHHGGEHMVEQSCPPHSNQGTGRKRKGLGTRYSFQGHTPLPPVIYSLQPLKFPPFPNTFTSQLGTKASTHEPLENIPNHNTKPHLLNVGDSACLVILRAVS